MSDFQGMTKHVGVLNNTGKNVVVVFMRLPNDPNNALVVDTDALPDQYNESLRKIVESVEGQQSKNLADVLGRRMSPDGSNMTLLEKFHHAARLEKVPVSLVTMTPRKGLRWPLVDVLKAIDESSKDQPQAFDDLDPETRAAIASEIQKFNVHATNLSNESSSNKTEQAVSLIRQAELIEADAVAMRTKAYQMDPSLRPNKQVSEKKVQESMKAQEASKDSSVTIDVPDTPKKTKKKVEQE